MDIGADAAITNICVYNTYINRRSARAIGASLVRREAPYASQGEDAHGEGKGDRISAGSGEATLSSSFPPDAPKLFI